MNELNFNFKIELNNKKYCSELQEIPFGHIFYEVVSHNFKLNSSLFSIFFDRGINDQIMIQLCQRLSTYLSWPLFDLFQAYSALGVKEIYSKICSKMSNNGILDLIKQYPVWGDLIEQQINQVNLFLNTIGKELQTDLYEIDKHFKINLPITGININISDTHIFGKSVIQFTDNKGEQFYYKPRKSDTIKLYEKVINLITANSKFCIPSFYSNGHSWIKGIKHESTNSNKDINEFYINSGICLAVLFLLNGTDSHASNIIASKSIPHLVDLETLGQPVLMFKADINDDSPILKKLNDSVLRTGMLPQYVSDLNNGILSVGGLSKSFPYQNHQPLFVNINSDDMKIGSRKRIKSNDIFFNIPYLNNCPVFATTKDKQVAKGFQLGISKLLANRNELEKILSSQKDLNTRIVIRPTQYYSAVLSRNLKSKFLTSQTKWKNSILEDLKLTFTHIPQSIVEAELEYIARLDVPHFYSSFIYGGVYNSQDNKLLLSAQKGDISGIKNIGRKLTYLSSENISFQTSLILNSFNRNDLFIKESHNNNVKKSDLFQLCLNRILDAKIEVENKIHFFSNQLVINDEPYTNLSEMNNSFLDGKLGVLYSLVFCEHSLYNSQNQNTLFRLMEYLKQDLLSVKTTDLKNLNIKTFPNLYVDSIYLKRILNYDNSKRVKTSAEILEKKLQNFLKTNFNELTSNALKTSHFEFQPNDSLITFWIKTNLLMALEKNSESISIDNSDLIESEILKRLKKTEHDQVNLIFTLNFYYELAIHLDSKKLKSYIEKYFHKHLNTDILSNKSIRVFHINLQNGISGIITLSKMIQFQKPLGYINNEHFILQRWLFYLSKYFKL